jgi:hypothetical protein
MKNMFAAFLSMFGASAAEAGSQACLLVVLDEIETPKSLIK